MEGDFVVVFLMEAGQIKSLAVPMPCGCKDRSKWHTRSLPDLFSPLQSALFVPHRQALSSGRQYSPLSFSVSCTETL